MPKNILPAFSFTIQLNAFPIDLVSLHTSQMMTIENEMFR